MSSSNPQPSRPNFGSRPMGLGIFGPMVTHRLVNRHRMRSIPKEPTMTDPQLGCARQQILAARDYTRQLLEQTPESLWFQAPPGARSHIAWQVGHLAMAQFRLGIFFVRDVLADDQAVLSQAFMDHYRKGTTADAPPESLPGLEELRSAMDRIHHHILSTWDRYETLDMQSPALCQSHRIVTTKVDALFWMVRHEMIHAGQIGMIRRMLGCASMW